MSKGWIPPLLSQRGISVLQEAEIEEDVEATRVLDWDKSAADAAYRAKVEEAEARQRLILEQRAREVSAMNSSFASQAPCRLYCEYTGL